MPVDTVKYANYVRFIPSFYKPDRNTYVRALLLAWAEQDDLIVTGIQQAKEQIFVESAELRYLNALGANVGVFRPLSFNMSDSTFRQLIPVLSYHPKQIRPTIQAVLDIFFGEDNPDVDIYEIYNNNVIIRIPSSVPTLRRGLKGSAHLHDYNCYISVIDDLNDKVTVTFNHTITEDLFAEGKFGQGNNIFDVVSNTAGRYDVEIQFGSGFDLSVLNTTDECLVLHPKYVGPFLRDPSATYTITKHRGILGQTINQGQVYATITMEDSSDIPDEPGELVFDYGGSQKEAHVKYLGRPNNTSLLLNPTSPFAEAHSAGEPVNLITVPQWDWDQKGTDFAAYITGISAARLVAQELIRSIVATGVTITWEIVEESY